MVLDRRLPWERVESVNFPLLGKYDGFNVIKDEILYALKTIGVSKCVLTLNPSDEEVKYVITNLTLSTLQNLKTVELTDAEVPKIMINGIYCTSFKHATGCWEILTPDGVRPMTSIEKIEAGMKEETEQVKEAEISETERIRRVFQRIEKPLLKFPFYLEYSTSSTANARGATLWSTLEEFLSEYYITVLLSQSRVLIDKITTRLMATYQDELSKLFF
jgi:hypothetical protein